MLNSFLIAALLVANVDGGVARKKPSAKQLSAPRAQAEAPLDGGVLRAPAMGASTAAADAGTASVDARARVDAGTPAVKKVAMSPEVKTLVDRMQAFYEGTSDFKASFSQVYTYKLFKRTQTSSGTVVFKKPALMRWEYEKPAKKSFVLAGDTVYAHDPEAMMLTVAGINTNQLSASVTFLWGKGKLADEFSIQRAPCAGCKGVLLELTPLMPDARFQKVKLEVDPKSAQVIKSTVIDPDGSENAITFSNLTPNTGVPADHFKMNPPEGTQVQDFRKK